MKLKQKGFTLIEVMIVVAIVAVLVSFAYPSYQTHMLKTKRSDCKTGLLRFADLQERFYSQRNTYANNTATLFGGAAGQQLSPEGICDLKVTSGDASTFLITATALDGQLSDSGCTILTLNQAGTKTPAACW